MLEFHLKREWATIVGPSLAAHTRPDSIKFRKLWVSAEHSVWLQQLVFLKPQLLKKVKEFPQGSLISDIGFRVGDIPSPHKSVPLQTEKSGPSTEVLNFAKEVTASIQNPKLRACLARTITKSLSST